MPQKTVDLVGLFQAVTQSLQENQQTLDQADTYNQDHGTNMVKTFATITDALEKKKGGSASTALAYAGKMVAKSSTSSSGKLYAENLAQAASQFKGKKVTDRGAMDLLQTLIGAEQGSGAQPAVGHPSSQPSAGSDILGSLLGGMTSGQASGQASAGGDMLGGLLGGMTGGQASGQSSAGGDILGGLLGGMTGGQASGQSSAGGDMLGALLGGLTGGQSSGATQGSGIDLQDLLQAGMAFMQAKQQGQGNLMAIVQAVAAASKMGTSAHRSQSTQIVVQSFLQALSGMK